MSRNRDGFALIIVIWAIGAIALLFTTYIAASRYRTIEAFATSEHAKAEALANAGVNLALGELLAAASKGPAAFARFDATGRPALCMVGRSIVAVAVSNENGKVDLNTSQPELLMALIGGATSDGDHAKALTRLIMTLRKTSETHDTKTDPTPQARIFRSVVDLGQVPGISRREFADLDAMVTVQSRSLGINPRLAAPVLLETLTRGSPSSQSRGRDLSTVFFLAGAPGNNFRIASDAATPAGARFSRDATVEITQGPPLSYSIKEWREGLSHMAPITGLASDYGPC